MVISCDIGTQQRHKKWKLSQHIFICFTILYVLLYDVSLVRFPFVCENFVYMYLLTQAITAYLCDFHFISLLLGEYVMQCVNKMRKKKNDTLRITLPNTSYYEYTFCVFSSLVLYNQIKPARRHTTFRLLYILFLDNCISEKFTTKEDNKV